MLVMICYIFLKRNIKTVIFLFEKYSISYKLVMVKKYYLLLLRNR